MKNYYQLCKKKKCSIISFFIVLLLITASRFSAEAQNAAMRRPISPEQPMWLIHIDTWNWPDPQKIIDLIPEDIRPYVVMNISLSISHDASTCAFNIVQYGYETAKSWVRTCAENQMWCTIQPSSGGFSHFSDFDLSVYEEFYQDYPNFIGFNYCEQFWGFDDACSVSWTQRVAHWVDLMELSQKYGGYLIVSFTGGFWGAGLNPVAMMKRNPDFAAICKSDPEHFILCEKYTMAYGFHDIESTCEGAYLSGFSGQYGIRFDQCGWVPNASEDFPVASGAAPVIEHIMLTGETVIDGPELIWQQCTREASRGTTSDGYTTRQWETFPQFDNISMDIFRKILDGTIRILSRKEVIDRTKVVIINDVSSGDDRALYSSPETLFEGLYLMDNDGTNMEQKSWFKKTGRYPAVPTVYQLADADANSFQVKVNKSAYSSRWPTTNAKISEFNSLFPLEYTGTIYAGRHENGWVTYNPFKTGQTANGNIPFKYNTCTSMDLSYSQYTTGIIKEYSNKVTFYLTNFDNANTALKTDVIKINGCSSQPSYTYTDRASHQASTVTSSYSGGVFTLNVTHNGPLDITVNCSGSATDRLTSYTTTTLITPDKPAVYTGPRQYEAECFDYKSIARIVTNGVGSGVANYAGQGFIEFGTSSSASVRDNVSVQNSGTYRLETKYAVTGGNVTTIDLYVNGTKVATPSFTQTSTLSNWGTNTQNINLNAGTNTIEFRANATGANSVYFDNITVTNTNSGSSEVWLEAECGTVGSLWDIASDANASNNEYVSIQSGNNSTSSAPTGENDQISYTFTISESGVYTLWGRVIAPSPDDDSFWVRMDDGSFSMWNGITYSTSWTWDDFQSYNLSAGNHTLTIAYREDGTQLDKIYIGNSTPSGTGSEGTNCNTGETIIQENETGFCGVDGSVDSEHAGYTGTGFANTINAAGNGVDWMVNFSSSGTKTFTFRYASSNDRAANLIVNGSTVASNINFPSTGAWATWGTVSVSANTNSGVSSVRLEATGSDGLGNIDYMEVTGGSATGCRSLKGAIANIKSPSGDVKIFPNPAHNGNFSITITGNEDDSYQLLIYAPDGKTVYNDDNLKAGMNEINSGLKSGIYMIHLIHGTHVNNQKLIID